MTKETIIRIVKSEPSGLCTKCEKDGCGLWSHKNITYVGNNNNKNLISMCIDQNNMYDYFMSEFEHCYMPKIVVTAFHIGDIFAKTE